MGRLPSARRERSRLLAEKAKLRDGYTCQVCELSFEASYKSDTNLTTPKPGSSEYTPGRGDADAPKGKENAPGQLKKDESSKEKK